MVLSTQMQLKKYALEAFANEVCASNVDTRKVLLGFVLIFFGMTICWKSNQQSVVALSITLS